MIEHLKKHSVNIAGHATSVTLEPIFWEELQHISEERKISLNALIALVDGKKAPKMNLSSALRVYVLQTLKGNSN